MKRKFIFGFWILIAVVLFAGAMHYIVNYTDISGYLIDRLKNMHGK